MKIVKILYEILIDDDQLKDETDVRVDGFEDYADAVSCDGIDAIIDGSYEYVVKVDVAEEVGEWFARD